MGCFLSKKAEFEDVVCELRINRELDSVKRDKVMEKLNKIEKKIEKLNDDKCSKKTASKRFTTGYYASGL